MTSFAIGAWVGWLGHLGLLVIFAFLAFAAWWAIFSDPPRGRRRCPRCWYDLTHSPSLACSECGAAARTERDLLRSRRRPVVAVAAFAGCTGIGLYELDIVATRGAMSYVPDPVLVWMLPAIETSSSPVARELDWRIRANDLSEGSWLALARRCAAGDAGAAPPGDAWIAKYEHFWGAVVRRSPQAGDERWPSALAALLEIPPRVDLASPRVWPLDVAPTLDVSVRTWWPGPPEMRLVAHARLAGAEPVVFECPDAPIQRRSLSLDLPPLPAGGHEIDVDLAIERRRAGGGWAAVHAGVVRVPVEVGGSLAEMLPPVRGAVLDEIVGGVFRNGIVRWQGGSLPVRLRIDPDPSLIELFEGVAIGVRVEVFRNGALARGLDAWWRAGPGGSRRVAAWEVPFWDDEVLGAPDAADDEWSLRIRGVPELALRVDGAVKYWDGEVTVVAPVRAAGGLAPPRGWLREADAARVRGAE